MKLPPPAWGIVRKAWDELMFMLMTSSIHGRRIGIIYKKFVGWRKKNEVMKEKRKRVFEKQLRFWISNFSKHKQHKKVRSGKKRTMDNGPLDSMENDTTCSLLSPTFHLDCFQRPFYLQKCKISTPIWLFRPPRRITCCLQKWEVRRSAPSAHFWLMYSVM